jgi:hypothetical protein
MAAQQQLVRGVDADGGIRIGAVLQNLAKAAW